MKHTVFTALLLLACLTAQAQTNVDSLLNVLRNGNLPVEEQFKLYKTVLESTGSSRILLECINSGLPLAQKEKNKYMESVFNEYTGRIYVGKALYDSALFYFDKALQLAIEAKDSRQEGSVYTSYSVAYGNQSMYNKLLEYQLKSLKIAEKNNDKQGILAALGNIGSAYSALQDNKHAIRYSERALALAEELNLATWISHCHYSLGSSYYNLKEYNRSEEHFLQALEAGKQLHHNNTMDSYILIALSELYSGGLKDMNKAEKYGQEGLAIAEQLHNPALTANAYKGMSNIYRIREKYKECDIAAMKAWELDSINIDMGLNITANLTYANVHLGNKQKATLFLNKYHELVHKYNEKSLHESLTEQEVKYETEKKEIKIAAMEKARILYTWIIILVIAISIALLVIYLYNRRLSRQKIKQLEQEKQVEVSKSVIEGETAERKRLARELHDGLGGMLAAVKINLDNLDHLENARSLLDHSIEELRHIARNLMPVALTHSGLKTSLDDFCRAFPHVHFHFYGENKRISENRELLLYRCVIELVNNAVKYSEAENINVQLIQNEKNLLLTVHDDGCGFDPNKVKQGLGLKNLSDRLTIHNGKLDINSTPGQGTEVNVELSIGVDP
ncbi:MAG: sensor histidine kinase [Dysgonamonadaceae bacterium]|jgi:signal transduction histidine kinase|nr:sensor histidine kinase [Dysgonamonadaceae bacterium]